MSSVHNSKGQVLVIVLVTIVLVVAGLLSFMYFKRNTISRFNSPSQIKNDNSASQQPQPQSTNPPSATSTTSIDQDLSDIDNSLKSLDTDSQTVNDSLNDQSVNLN